MDNGLQSARLIPNVFWLLARIVQDAAGVNVQAVGAWKFLWRREKRGPAMEAMMVRKNSLAARFGAPFARAVLFTLSNAEVSESWAA